MVPFGRYETKRRKSAPVLITYYQLFLVSFYWSFQDFFAPTDVDMWIELKAS